MFVKKDSPTYSSTLGGRVLQVPAQSKIPIPLSHTSVQMFIRPLFPNDQYQYCIESIDWSNVKKPCEVLEIQTTCRTNQLALFRMCIAIRRDNFPPEISSHQPLPGHTITILAPITIKNLLPHEILYSAGEENGRIPPGKLANLHGSNVKNQLEINIQIDGYTGFGTVSMSLLHLKIMYFKILKIVLANNS